MAGDSEIDEALGRIEGTILPGISLLLDTLIDAAALTGEGVDAETCAAEIRSLTRQVEALAREVEAAGAAPKPCGRRSAA